MKISDIPISSLTHINVAFGYIKPNSYIVHPMEPANDEIFKDLMELKLRAPGLQIWLSLGGWTFSDNGTDTQPVFGDLSSTPAKRQKFINELVKFMRYWGFDGVDIDWEYVLRAPLITTVLTTDTDIRERLIEEVTSG